MKQFIIALTVLLVLPITAFSQNLKGIDEIAPYSEGLAAVRQGNQWGFINEEGTLVIDFRNDVHWNKDADTSRSDVSGVRYPMFHGGRCLIAEMVEDGIPLYGFIDTSGNTVIEPKFLNIYHFKDGYTTGVRTIEEYFEGRQNIQMTKRRYKLPFIGAKNISDGLMAVWIVDEGWEIRKLTL